MIYDMKKAYSNFTEQSWLQESENIFQNFLILNRELRNLLY